MDIKDFTKEEVIKVMLQAAKNARNLTELETKYETKVESLSEYRTNAIINLLDKETCLAKHPVFVESDSPSVVVFPFLSSEGEGLTEKGEDELSQLIKSCEKELAAEKKSTAKSIASKSFGWIMGIVAALIIAFVIWKLGWQ